MKSAFKAFMNKLIDYAGLFPPANLPMDAAIKNYLNYITGEDEWMLSRFICPASRLNELDNYREDFRSFQKPVQISFLGSGGKSIDEFFRRLNNDLQNVRAFKDTHGDKFIVDTFEARFPDFLIEESNPVRITEFLNQVAEIIESYKLGELMPFYEGGFWGEWSKTIDALSEGISYHNVFIQTKPDGKYQAAGYKLRCGGIEPPMYPSPEQIAHVILTCKRHQIPMKATAGLHHPLRHFNNAEQVRMHGFLNIFGAGILAQNYDLNVDRIIAIIEDENLENFVFTSSEFKWKELTVTATQIKESRSQRIISFGSCSFDEPREDLRKLRLL